MNKYSPLAFILFFSVAVLAFPNSSEDPLLPRMKALSESLYSEAVTIRRQLHRIPEPCFMEKETSEFIKQYLKSLGFSQIQTLAGTGLKAVLNGNKNGPVVALRTDMDALPITEQNEVSYKSTKNGFMHACGHDIHMTNFLIAAKILSRFKDSLPGKVVLIVQPCEEGTSDGSPSGAQRMIDEGVLTAPQVNAVIGLHVLPGIPLGSIATRPGPLMANVASLFITIRGRASHGALPNQGVDALYASALAITQFQGLVSRLRDPIDPAVLTIGTIHGGVRMNVIAEEVRMEGTLRSFTFETETMIEKGIENILKGLQMSLGIEYSCQISRMSRYVDNDSVLTSQGLAALKVLLGPKHVLEAKPMTIAEDFANYSHAVPSLFYFLGAGDTPPLHSSTFLPDDSILKTGPLSLAWLAYDTLKRLRFSDD